MRRTSTFIVALVLLFALAAPAFAVSGADGAGKGFGTHHAEHAVTHQGFTGGENGENPGMHEGFAGWGG